MRVPTYKQQTSFTTKGGGGRFLTAQINPSVMAKQGQVLSEIGDDITRIGLRKLEVETDTEVNVAKRAMNTELYLIREKFLKSENPVKAELKAKAEMQTLLKQYVNGTKINPATTEPYISTNKSKARFLSVGQDLLSSNILEYVKENNKLISEVNKANISDTTNELVKSAIDADNFGEFNQRYQQIFSVNDKNPGVLRLALTNGDYDQKEYATAFDKTAEILVDGLILKKLKSSPSALAAAIEIFDDPSANVAITNALGLLDNKADKRAKVIKLAKQIDDERVQEIEREEKDQIEKNDKLYAKIINADLDINTSESVISVESIPSNTQINIVDDSPSNLEIISENTSVDITERLIISGGFDFRFNNIIDNPLSNNDAGQIGIRTNNPQFDLHISGNLFSDVISSSRASFNDLSSDVISSSQTLLVSDGITNTLLIKSGSNTPISINPVGIIRFDNYQYTPPVVEGGLLYSGSEFYLGLE